MLLCSHLKLTSVDHMIACIHTATRHFEDLLTTHLFTSYTAAKPHSVILDPHLRSERQNSIS